LSPPPASQPVDRAGPPAPRATEPYVFPAFSRRVLPGGLEVLPVPVAGSAVASLELVFPAGSWYDPPAAAGLGSLVSGLLDEGTEEHSALEIASAVERLGGRLETGADWDVGSASVRLLGDYLDEGIGLLAEVALRPSFPADEVERARRNRLTDLLRRRDQPGVLAGDHFSRLVYGGTPYGRPLVGLSEDVQSLTREDAVAFFHRYYPPARAVLIGVGELDPERLTAAAAAAFGDAPAAEPLAAPEIAPPPIESVRVRIVDRPGAAQTELRIGHQGVPRSHPDWSPLAVLNTLLGGKFTSRINLNLRERHGFTYGASSRFAPRLGPGPFVVNAAVANPAAGAAAREVLAELDRLRDAPVEPEELSETKSYILGVFPYTLQTVDGILHHLETLAVYGLPDDYYAPERYLARLDAVSREEIQRVARDHLHPERAVIVAVGPAGELAPQLEGLGELDVVAS
jgi:zinc protease